MLTRNCSYGGHPVCTHHNSSRFFTDSFNTSLTKSSTATSGSDPGFNSSVKTFKIVNTSGGEEAVELLNNGERTAHATSERPRKKTFSSDRQKDTADQKNNTHRYQSHSSHPLCPPELGQHPLNPPSARSHSETSSSHHRARPTRSIGCLCSDTANLG